MDDLREEMAVVENYSITKMIVHNWGSAAWVYFFLWLLLREVAGSALLFYPWSAAPWFFGAAAIVALLGLAVYWGILWSYLVSVKDPENDIEYFRHYHPYNKYRGKERSRPVSLSIREYDYLSYKVWASFEYVWLLFGYMWVLGTIYLFTLLTIPPLTKYVMFYIHYLKTYARPHQFIISHPITGLEHYLVVGSHNGPHGIIFITTIFVGTVLGFTLENLWLRKKERLFQRYLGGEVIYSGLYNAPLEKAQKLQFNAINYPLAKLPSENSE